MSRQKAKKKRQPRIEKISVTSAIELDDKTVERIKHLFGKELEVSTSLDPEVIGGIQIRKTTELFDGTVRAQLNKLRDKLYKLKAYGGY